MKIAFSYGSPAQIETECLVVPVLDHGEKEKNDARAATTDKALSAAAQELASSGETAGKLFETVLLHKPDGGKAKRLLFVGCGKAKTFSAYELRRVAGAAVRFLKPKNIKRLAVLVPELRSGAEDAVRAIVEGLLVADFDPDTYKSDRKNQAIEEVTLVAASSANKDALQRAADEGRFIGESQNFTRELVNEPSNRLTPSMLAERARKMVESLGVPELTIETYGAEKLHELKMGAFWSVSQGSEEPPALIVARYEPKGAPEKPLIGLVGKGITFDTGGISIKPAEGMEKMKYDMAGGAAMLGAIRAIALLKPKVRVLAIVCASENMPSGKAQKPGDVQIAMSGKSIEIINTDAEGRLVLADGLHYARQLGATHLIDAATLTGACVVALGYVNAGVFTNDDGMWESFQTALKRAGEKMWRLPVDQDYQELIKSSIADIKNTGGR
ncbi:MAG: leucyl aminopeptidase family protein, partial [Terriglobales bacterium]